MSKSGIFVEAKLKPESVELLHNFVTKELKITPAIIPEKYHITLAYSKQWFDYRPSNMIRNALVRPVGWEVFGTDVKVLVLRVHAPVLTERNAQLKACGATSTFPDYKPHITVAPGEIETISLKVPRFTLMVHEEDSSPLEEDYVYNPKAMSEQISSPEHSSLTSSLIRDILS